MTIVGAGLTLFGFSSGIHVLQILGPAFLTVGLALILLSVLDIGFKGRRYWF